jgi:hypothetical protein
MIISTVRALFACNGQDWKPEEKGRMSDKAPSVLVEGMA